MADAQLESPIVYNSEEWVDSCKVIADISEGSVTNCNDLRDLVEELQGINWKCEHELSGITQVLDTQGCRLYGFDNLYSEVLPWLASKILEIPKLFPSGIPMLRQSQNQFLLFSHEQCVALLGALFLASTKYNHLALYEDSYTTASQQCKLLSFVNYFTMMHDQPPEYLTSTFVSFERISLETKPLSHWSNLKDKLSQVTISGNLSIEDCPDPCLRIDFANKYIGGGTLLNGNVQEEIAFTIHPEMIISMMISDVMLDNEAIIIVGAQRTTLHRGYGNNCSYVERFHDRRPLDNLNRIDAHEAAIDALELMYEPERQYLDLLVEREINKAYIGFLGDSHERKEFVEKELNRAYEARNKERSEEEENKEEKLRPIATGKWGCGIFCGDPELKLIIQWIAATKARRDMVFMTFNDENLKTKSERLIEKYKNDNIEKLMTDLRKTLNEKRNGSQGSVIELMLELI